MVVKKESEVTGVEEEWCGALENPGRENKQDVRGAAEAAVQRIIPTREKGAMGAAKPGKNWPWRCKSKNGVSIILKFEVG